LRLASLPPSNVMGWLSSVPASDGGIGVTVPVDAQSSASRTSVLKFALFQSDASCPMPM